jgi:hypothetical protein
MLQRKSAAFGGGRSFEGDIPEDCARFAESFGADAAVIT